VIDGWVDANLDGIKQAKEVHDEFKNKVDYVGVQYYGSQPMQGFGLAPIPGFPFLQGLPVRCSADSPTCSDFNQPTDPGGFREVLEIAASYKPTTPSGRRTSSATLRWYKTCSRTAWISAATPIGRSWTTSSG
jgi:hypothetical protein